MLVREGARTGALLLDDAEGAGDGLAVRKHIGSDLCHAVQTIHGAGSIVRVWVGVDDANKHAEHARGKL